MNLTHYDDHGGGGGVGLNEPTPSTSSGYLGLDNNSHPNYYADDSSDEYPISNYHILESQPQLYQQQQQQQHQQQQHQQQQQPSTSFNSTAFNPNYHHHHHLPQTYYEPPLFQPPPSSSYYSPHQYSQIPILQPPPPPPPSLIQSTFPAPHLSSWYQTPAVNQQRDQMLNMLQFSNSTNGREARNRAEKNRRDKLNGSIHELSTMVPHVAESPRRVDKTAVLRFSAHGLRVHYVFGKTINTPPKVKPQVTDSLMKLLDSFLLTVTCHGQIVLVSPSIEQHLGHCQTDLFGQNISHITHPDDREMLKKQLIPTGLETLFDIQPEDERGEPRPRTKDEEEEIDRKLREDKRNFTLRLARAGPRSEPITYEIVKIDGCFRRADSAPRGVKASTFPSGLQLIRRARGRDDSIPLHTISGNDIVLVAMARVIKPPKICERLLEANNYEYKTRHLIDGRIIQCDQRISLVAGYMTEEVNGLSPFTFMHQDDVRWVIVALRQMYDCNSSYGESCYRLITRTGKFVFLRTRGYLEIDKDTNKVHSFVCINTLVSEDEGRRRVREMKNKFSIIINTKVQQSAIDAPASENPHQLERAIIYLIQNLENSNRHIDNVEQNSKRDGSESDTSRQSKSPPLAIIPPKPSTIKSSIAKSMTVVNATAGKNLHNIQAHDKIKTSSTTSKTINNNSNNNNENVGNLTRPSVVQKSGSSRNKISEGNNNNNSQVTDSILVKEDDSYSEESDRRVPPLPNSKDYFEMSTSTIDISFSIEDDPVTTELLLNEPVVCQQTSVLKRTHFSNEIDDDDDDDDSSMSIPKRRNLETENIVSPPPPYQETIDPASDLTEILPSTFGAIDRSLLDIENVTNELKGQCKTYSVDQSSAYKLEEIIEEHQEQREMLENIQNEFHARIHSTGPTTSTNLTTNIQENENGSSKNDLKPR